MTYSGEPGGWPIVSSSFGQFDLAGFAKSSSYWYRAQWLCSVNVSDPGRPFLPQQHVVRVSQSWTKPPWDNMTIDNIVVFSDLPYVELILNSKSRGVKRCPYLSFASFGNVVYESGNLTAVARLDLTGPVLATHTQISSGSAAGLLLTLDAPSAKTGTGTSLLLDGHDAALIRATVVDANGLTVDSNRSIRFTITSGPGRIIGVHNGNASSRELNNISSSYAYHGLARAVVKVTTDAASGSLDDLNVLYGQIEVNCGSSCSTNILTAPDVKLPTSIVVSASTNGLPSSSIEIPVSTDARRHSVLASAATTVRTGTTLHFD